MRERILKRQARNAYRFLLSDNYRRQLRFLVFDFLRRLGSVVDIENFGFSVCRGYKPASIANLSEMEQNSNGKVKIHVLFEKNDSQTQPAMCLKEQNLLSIVPVLIGTETIVLDVRDQRFSLRNCHLFSPEDEVIDEVGKSFRKMPVAKQLLQKSSHVDGTIAYLSNINPSNYYHWMCRTLSLLRIYQDLFGLHKIDYFYVGNFKLCKFHQESLLKAGIPLNKVLQKACTSDRIIAAITNRIRDFNSLGLDIPVNSRINDPINKENFFFVRNLFYKELIVGAIRQNRRLYLQRGGVNRRKVLNEEQLIHQLEKDGFEVVTMDGKSVGEQAELFYQAEIIVAPHGAALTNLLFAQPGVKVIELFPYGFANNCYYVMASYINAIYFYLEGEKVQDSRSITEVHALDILIDLQKLKLIVKEALYT